MRVPFGGELPSEWRPVETKESSDTYLDLMGGKVACRELDWYRDKSKFNNGNFDLIIASDCTLTPSDSAALLAVIKLHIAPSVREIIVGCCREREGFDVFLRKATKEFSVVEEVQSSEFSLSYKSQRLVILRIQP